MGVHITVLVFVMFNNKNILKLKFYLDDLVITLQPNADKIFCPHLYF